jgi:decaprenylphospho-beta-D-erythro-pentofuranosid-2-ulose 2-reductase
MKSGAVIIGASSGLGKELAYIIAAGGIPSVISSRNEAVLASVKEDLQAKFRSDTRVIPVDTGKLTDETATAFVNDCFGQLGDIDQVYITSAVVDGLDEGSGSSQILDHTTAVNYSGIAHLVCAFAKRLAEKRSSIAIVSSIAAVRPRGRNIAYAASKRALEFFVRGLQHYYVGKQLHLQLYRVGYMDTPMSSGVPVKLKKVSPAKVARHIFDKRGRSNRLSYFPRYWGMIALLLRWMPWWMYKKMKF